MSIIYLSLEKQAGFAKADILALHNHLLCRSNNIQQMFSETKIRIILLKRRKKFWGDILNPILESEGDIVLLVDLGLKIRYSAAGEKQL